MISDDTQSHSFVIRIWQEDTVDEHGAPLWRGHITHVFSGKRQYFESLSAIASFITPYLHESGVDGETDSS